MEANVPRKKSRLAKNKKKAWRKVDITDVEEFLEDERLQERTGGLVAEKSDTELFTLERNVTSTESEKTIPKKKRKKVSIELKCYSHLLPDPKIKLARKPQPSRKVKDKRAPHIIEKLNGGIKTQKELKAEVQRKLVQEKKLKKNRAKGSIIVASYDLWDNNPKEIVDPFAKPAVKRPKRKAPSALPAVQVPHPGASYNPDYQDYQDLLAKAHEVEEKKLVQEKKLEKFEKELQKVDSKTLERTWISEMSEGIKPSEEADEEERDESGDDAINDDDPDRISVNPPVRREAKKTKTQRNKEKRKKMQEKLKAQEKTEKTKANEIFRLKSMKTEIDEREAELQRRAQERRQKWQAQDLKTRKLGRLKFEEPLLEIKLSDELEGSLRKLKPEGNLFVDRIKSLEKRNIMEPRQQAKKYRKYKRKTVIKRSHKV
ncbi:ribosome biogenesis protein NOP53-like isoform X2 [Crassostrea virginica]|uniref:Ribosome biogenesis protein NOP53 n=1 Tax=Crassostrea virginica TaxID=6565 RepID=A0A8B8DX81_CRAVI|nr:ribosome biogenesis protein NOP53-like isoform X1 [Crassostrea virginica]XP_022332115.1 ribosome biogenesis protein NOP53-like isoform X2 [Crassostrea virginica]